MFKNKTVYLVTTKAGDIERGIISRSLSTTLLFLRDYLLRNGFYSEIIDCDKENLDNNQLVERLIKEQAEIVGFTSYTATRFITYDAIRKLKKSIPNCYIIVGGRHFSALPDETLDNLHEVDCVVRKEGEITLYELTRALTEEKELDDILGITFRKGGKNFSTPDRPPEKDLDKLHYDYRKMTKNDISLSTMKNVDLKSISILAGRGCPFRCLFCSQSASLVRFRCIDAILDEIEYKLKVSGAKGVSFMDPTLTVNKEFITKFCEEKLKRKLDFKWHCYSRVDIDTEVLKLMKRAGVVSVDIALESGSPKILKVINKKISLDQFETFVQEASRLGIYIHVFTIISHPDETREDAQMTLSLLEKLKNHLSTISMQVTMIFPDAALHSVAKERGILRNNFNWFEPYEDKYANLLGEDFDFKRKNSVPLYIEHLSLEFIKEVLYKCKNMQLKHFYTYGYFKNAVMLTWKSTIFDWKNENLKRKLNRIKNCFIALAYFVRNIKLSICKTSK